MPIAPINLLYGAIAICALLLIEGLFYLILDSRDGQRSVNRRMRMLSDNKNAHDVYAVLRRPEPESWKYLGSFGDVFVKLNNLLTQTGLTITTGRVVIIMALLSILVFFSLIIFSVKNTDFQLDGVMMAGVALLSFAIGVGAPLVYFRRLKSRRMKLFGEQLPDALDMMVRSLRVGHPVSVAIALAAQQMPDPIGTELGIAVDEISYGLELQEALANISKRNDVPDFDFVVVAITIQNETGGNLAEVLNGLSVVIRARFRMFKKIQALAAEGKFSAKLLACMPFVFAAFVFASKPKYYLQVIDDPLFFQIMLGAFILQVFGIFIMHKLINFRV